MIRRTIRTTLLLVIVATAAATAVAAEVDQSPLDVAIVKAFPNFTWPDEMTGIDEGKIREVRPIVITGAGDGSGRLFAATQPGTIHFFSGEPDAVQMQTFLDITDRVHYRAPENENEEGFLGMAFHPKFKENGELFVYYTAEYGSDESQRRSIISRFRVSADDPNRADPDSEEIIIEIPQKYWNHNGGTIVFGPDGYLYIGLGDGGAANDPHGNGQAMNTLMGKILRIDVDNKDPGLAYAIPKDNPFVGKQGVRPEIWATGIRNVWRIAFDRATGVLWAGDVGQDVWEEIDIIVKGGNYGWKLREGKHKFAAEKDEPLPGIIEPIWEYHHDVGKSITGGNVYRGKSAPELEGAYLYADFVSGQVWALWYDADSKQVTANRTLREKGFPVITFGEDDAGETYFSTSDGSIFKFALPAAN